MGVVELVSLLVEQPEAVAADLVPADREKRAVGTRHERLAELAEDVVAVVVRDVGAKRPERVDVRGGAVHREDVAARSQLRLHVQGLRLGLAGLLGRAVLRRVARARCLGDRRRGVRLARRRHLRRWRRRLHGDVDDADLDLAAGRQAGVVRGQSDVELDDAAPVAARARRRAGVDRLPAHDQLTPVAKRTAARHRLARDLEVRHAAPVRVPARPRGPRACGRARRHAVRGDLPAEEREARHHGLSLGRGVPEHRGRHRRRRRLRGQDGAVRRIREPAADGRCRVRRR